LVGSERSIRPALAADGGEKAEANQADARDGDQHLL
jgi:hypothetical protein